MRETVLVTGAGGFIGHHLVRFLEARNYRVRGVDIKAPEYEPSAAHEFAVLDLRNADSCREAVAGIDQIYHMAADMGGIGYITAFRAAIAKNNTLMNVNLLEAARNSGVKRLFFASSACVYPQYRQNSPDVTPLREEDAMPADPEEGYGWEKLYMERLCQYYLEDFGLETRVARFHNVYGPLGTYDGGKEKAPAAICRKIAATADGGEIGVWGDGKQTRSFLYIDDCVEGIYRLMESGCANPLNLGSEEMVSIDTLVDMVAAIAGKRIFRRYEAAMPEGVRGRTSDNSRLRQVLDWEPRVSLAEGLQRTYEWIHSKVAGAETFTGSDASCLPSQ